jgi:DNA-binding HxlR family transcriptional regulator
MLAEKLKKIADQGVCFKIVYGNIRSDTPKISPRWLSKQELN